MAMTPTASHASPRSPAVIVAAVVAGAAHLVVGFFYLISGLAVPGYALLPLWVWWGVLTAVLIRLAVRGSWWTLAVPVVAFATWWLVLTFGDAVLSWTA